MPHISSPATRSRDRIFALGIVAAILVAATFGIQAVSSNSAAPPVTRATDFEQWLESAWQSTGGEFVHLGDDTYGIRWKGESSPPNPYIVATSILALEPFQDDLEPDIQERLRQSLAGAVASLTSATPEPLAEAERIIVTLQAARASAAWAGVDQTALRAEVRSLLAEPTAAAKDEATAWAIRELREWIGLPAPSRTSGLDRSSTHACTAADDLLTTLMRHRGLLSTGCGDRALTVAMLTRLTNMAVTVGTANGRLTRDDCDVLSLAAGTGVRDSRLQHTLGDAARAAALALSEERSDSPQECLALLAAPLRSLGVSPPPLSQGTLQALVTSALDGLPPQYLQVDGAQLVAYAAFEEIARRVLEIEPTSATYPRLAEARVAMTSSTVTRRPTASRTSGDDNAPGNKDVDQTSTPLQEAYDKARANCLTGADSQSIRAELATAIGPFVNDGNATLDRLDPAALYRVAAVYAVSTLGCAAVPWLAAHDTADWSRLARSNLVSERAP